MAILTLAPGGAGDLTEIPYFVGADTHWQTQLTNDGGDSRVSQAWAYAGYWKYDLYALAPTNQEGIISNVRIAYYAAANLSIPVSYARSILKTYSTIYYSEVVEVSANYVLYVWDLSANPYTNQAWTWTEITALQAGIGLESPWTSVSPGCTQVYVEVTYLAAPTVTTQAETSIATITATGNGTITSIGGASVTQHGHCWATTINPTTSNSKTQNGAGNVGAFTSATTGLSTYTFYYTRAYATNSVGTSYGSNVTFTTLTAFIPKVFII